MHRYVHIIITRICTAHYLAHTYTYIYTYRGSSCLDLPRDLPDSYLSTLPSNLCSSSSCLSFRSMLVRQILALCSSRMLMSMSAGGAARRALVRPHVGLQGG